MLNNYILRNLKNYFRQKNVPNEFKSNLWIDYDINDSSFNSIDGVYGFDYNAKSIDEITRLDLSFCNLDELPEEIVYLKNLTHLNLCGNNINSLSENLFNLKKLKSLNVSKNQLDLFPKAIFKIKSLKNLNLSSNKISSFGKKISNLINLEILDLSLNLIEDLPKEIGDLKRLLYLDLSINKLKLIVREITKLSKLRVLYIAGGRDNSFHYGGIEKLPEEFGELRNLQILDISRNQIQELPNSFKYINSLEKLYLDHSCFIKFPKEIYSLKNLILLDLGFNYYLDSIPDGIENLLNLQYLTLCDNNINEVSYKIEDLKKLVLLNLKNNNFLELPSSLNKIERFYYDDQKIKFLSSKDRMDKLDYNE